MAEVDETNKKGYLAEADVLQKQCSEICGKIHTKIPVQESFFTL